MQKYSELQDIIAILGMDELGDEDRNTVCVPVRSSASSPSRPTLRRNLPVSPVSMYPLKETLRGFKAIIDGEMDEYPEAAFYNVGTLDDVIRKAEALKAQNA